MKKEIVMDLSLRAWLVIAVLIIIALGIYKISDSRELQIYKEQLIECNNKVKQAEHYLQLKEKQKTLNDWIKQIKQQEAEVDKLREKVTNEMYIYQLNK